MWHVLRHTLRGRHHQDADAAASKDGASLYAPGYLPPSCGAAAHQPPRMEGHEKCVSIRACARLLNGLQRLVSGPRPAARAPAPQDATCAPARLARVLDEGRLQVRVPVVSLVLVLTGNQRVPGRLATECLRLADWRCCDRAEVRLPPSLLRALTSCSSPLDRFGKTLPLPLLLLPVHRQVPPKTRRYSSQSTPPPCPRLRTAARSV